MAVTFDQNDMASWYFSGLTRAEATQMLMGERESGVFLVRDSYTIQGDYVLCVKEGDRVSHYIINRVVQPDGGTRYRIGDHLFSDLPQLLAFYRLHFLDSTPLVRPHSALIETVMAKYDFDGNDVDDLPFRKGEVLEVICKDEEQWWTARNRAGNTGSIPVPYVMRYVETTANSNNSSANSNSTGATTEVGHTNSHGGATHPVDLAHPPSGPPHPRTNMQRVLPAMARVRQSREPNAYDKTALRLEKGGLIKVTKMNINGQWEGELDGRTGHFPFTHIEFLDDCTDAGANGS